MFQQFDYEAIVRALPLLWDGMQLTLLLTVLAMAGGLIIGVLLALLRVSKNRMLAAGAGAYVNLFRATPLILVIFWFYFLVPVVVGRPVGPFYSVLIAFTLFEAAYYCEIVRAGIQSVKKGQINAGFAIGLTYIQTMRYVILPQALRNMIPVLLTQAIVLFQDTSLVYVVALRDFLTTADMVAVRDNRVVELYLFAAVVYFVVSFAGSLGVRGLQRRYGL